MNTSLTPTEKVLGVRAWCGSRSVQTMSVRFLYEGTVRDVEHEEFSLHAGSDPEKLTLKVNGAEVDTLDFNFWELHVADTCDELTLIACGGLTPTLRAGIFAFCYKFVMAR